MIAKSRASLLIVPIIVLLFAGCENKWWDVTPFSKRVVSEWTADTTIYLGTSSQIVISAVGDIMVHGPQIRAQHNQFTNSYDFSNNFRWISSYLWLSDLSIGNLETTLAGSTIPYAGYPLFNSPDELAYNLRDAGFDVIVTANNHSLDTGINGLTRTANVVRQAGLTPLGTRATVTQPTWELREVNGIQVAMTAWTYETPRYRNNRTINGLLLRPTHEHLINSYNPRDWQSDLPRMLTQISEMKNASADIILFYMHWGNEYASEPDENQRQLAAILAENGVDIIFGTHPHVVQPVEFIGETLVVWSMGNFLSNQRFESLQRRDVEDGLMVSVLVHKDHDRNVTSIREVHLLETWMHRYWAGGSEGRLVYEILPARNVLTSPSYFGVRNESLIQRISESVSRGQTILYPQTPVNIVSD